MPFSNVRPRPVRGLSRSHQRYAAVAYAEMPVFTEGALLAVEMTPGCGYGVVGPCEAMIKEHRSCLGYGAFYIEEKAPG